MTALVAQQQTSPAPPSTLDLRGRDLRQVDLKSVNLKGADLSGANLAGMDLSGLDLSGARLTGATLSGATLAGSNLDNVSAVGADFSQATLSGTRFTGADFSQANFSGASLMEAPTTLQATGGVSLAVSNVKLDGANFQGAVIDHIAFKNTSAVGTDFSDLKPRVANFMDSNLQGANFDGLGGVVIGFHNADLTNASFKNMSDATSKGFVTADLTGAKFAGSSLNRTSFSQTVLSRADLSGVIRQANDAHFGDTNLSNVDFSGFTFFRTTFDAQRGIGANGQSNPLTASSFSVQGTNFAGAKFDDVLFTNLDMVGANFAGATFQNTRFQSGNYGALTGYSGIEFGERQGQAVWMDSGEVPTSNGRSSATSGDEARRVSTTRTAPERDQSAALALATLTKLADQLAASNDPKGIL